MLEQDKWLLDNQDGLVSIDKWQQTVDLLAELLSAPAAFLVQHTPQGFQVTVASRQDSNPYDAGMIVEPEANIFCRKVVESGEFLYVKHAQSDPYWDTNPEVHNDGFSSYLGTPVTWPDGTPFGTFCAMDYQQTNYPDSHLKLIHQLRDILESDLQLVAVYHDVKELAITDELTQLYNRRGFNELCNQRLLLAKRMSIELALLYIDLDHFKQVNDEYGHCIGDDILRALSKALQDSVRESDILSRIGGDEFVALIAMTDEYKGIEIVKQRIAENFQQQLNQQKLPSVTLSIGFSLADTDDVEALLNSSDQSMYQAKRKNHQNSTPDSI